ncbi:MAG: hypothetical protein ACU88J_02645 [Gammaproteobacteria bacterium]
MGICRQGRQPNGVLAGVNIGKNNADCNGCGSQWDGKQTAPADGSAWLEADGGNCVRRVVRGGS